MIGYKVGQCRLARGGLAEPNVTECSGRSGHNKLKFWSCRLVAANPMGTTVTLNERHFKAAAQRARALGKSPEKYIEALIEAANITFDDILAPVRSAFRKSGVTEAELDDAIAEARKDFRDQSKRKSRK
jgi:hypothetical protein